MILRQAPRGLQPAVVMAREDRPAAPSLVGYVTGTADPTDVRSALAARLPAYMVPVAVVGSVVDSAAFHFLLVNGSVVVECMILRRSMVVVLHLLRLIPSCWCRWFPVASIRMVRTLIRRYRMMFRLEMHYFHTLGVTFRHSAGCSVEMV